MHKLFLPLIALGLFVWLASYSLGRTVSRQWHPSQTTLGDFIDRKQAEYDAGLAYRGSERTVLVWTNRKAAPVAEALSLTVSTIDDTVDVRRLP